MKKRKSNFAIKINLSNRWLYTFVAIGIVLFLGIGVYAALGAVPNPGHAVSELQPCSNGEILQMQNGNWACATGTSGIKFKIIEIGQWNMLSTETKRVNSGLDPQKIRTISVMINTDDFPWQTFELTSKTTEQQISRGGISSINTDEHTGIGLQRADFFKNTNFDSTSINRGWITIGYVD